MLLAVGLLTGCIKSPHENFKDVSARKVGRQIDDPDLVKNNFVNPQSLVSVTALANGNKEMKYRYYIPGCWYIWEVNPAGTIVGWRFEGTEATCRLAP